MKKLLKKLWYNFIEKQYLSLDNNLAFFDELLQIKNRNYYDRIIKPYYAIHEVWIIFVDCDNLKKINDTQGHNTGSMVLRDIAQQLEEIEGAKEIVRIGGDEFLVFSDNPLCLNYII